MAYSEDINQHLDSQKLLPKGTWRAPNHLRVKSVWANMWFLLPIAIIVGIVLVAFAPAAAAQGAAWILWAFGGVLLALLAWSVIWFGHLHWTPFYDVKGITIHFDDPDWYVPPDVMQDFLQEIFDKWDRANLLDFPSEQLLKGSKLFLQSMRPVDPRNRVAPERVIGLTQPGDRISYVYAPYALTHGGAGYELRLQMVHVLHPYRDERDDIEWLKDNDVI